MVTVGRLVVLEAKAGKEGDLARFLTEALPLVQPEPQTTAWFAARLEGLGSRSSTRSPGEAGPQLPGCGALMERATELRAQPATIEWAEILAEKLP